MMILGRKFAEDSGVVVFPGVRQNHVGRAYCQGRYPDGKVCFVDAEDGRRFELTDGWFEADTLHVVVVDGEETYRAGSRSHFHAPEVRKERMPARYCTRGKDGVSRQVG